MQSPLRWPGGKGRLADQILPHLGPHVCYCEPCCGGAGMFWAKPREWSKCEVLNDLDGELVNFYLELHRRGRRLATELDAMPYSRALFMRLRASRPAGSFQRALRFWYVNRVSFGGKMTGGFGLHRQKRETPLNPQVLASLDATVERLRGVILENLDVTRCLLVYDRPTTVFYVDPPYAGDSMRKLYEVDFGRGDHDRLRQTLRHLRGRFLLSYDDLPAIRTLYAGCSIVRVNARYSLCAKSPTYDRQGAELLISNRILRPAARRGERPAARA